MLWTIAVWIRTESNGNVREYETDNFTSFPRTNCTPSGTCLTVPLAGPAKMVIGTGERRVGHLQERNAL